MPRRTKTFTLAVATLAACVVIAGCSSNQHANSAKAPGTTSTSKSSAPQATGFGCDEAEINKPAKPIATSPSTRLPAHLGRMAAILMVEHYNSDQSGAILSSLYYESGLNPEVKSTIGHGLAMWQPAAWAKLVTYAGKLTPPQSPYRGWVQMEYLVSQLRAEVCIDATSQAITIDKQLRSTDTIADAVAVFQYDYLRPIRLTPEQFSAKVSLAQAISDWITRAVSAAK